MERLKRIYRENDNAALFLKILFIMAASRFLMLILMIIYNLNMGTDRSISFLMNQWDAKRYYFMVNNGYTFPLDTDPQANWAFFPVYVIMCQIVKGLTFWKLDTYVTGMLVSNVCIFIAAFTAVKYLRVIKARSIKLGCPGAVNDGSRLERLSQAVRDDDGMLLVILMLAGPYSFYFASMYTEAAFVMFIALFFYFSAKKKYLRAGIMAALASGTRIVGCILVFSLIIELYMDINNGERISIAGIKNFIKVMLRTPYKILSVLLCPLGAFCYMTFLRFFCGDPWAYKNVQIAWREDEYFPIIGVLWKACTGQIEPRYTYMGWFCIGILVLYGYMIYKKYYSMAAFGILSLMVALTSHVMSTCRFTAGSYVAFIGLYDLLANMTGRLKVLKWIILIFFAAAEIWLLFMWYNSDCWLM